jgi:hypothetical protein
MRAALAQKAWADSACFVRRNRYSCALKCDSSLASVLSCTVTSRASSAVSYSAAMRSRAVSRITRPPTVITIATVIAIAQLRLRVQSASRAAARACCAVGLFWRFGTLGSLMAL